MKTKNEAGRVVFFHSSWYFAFMMMLKKLYSVFMYGLVLLWWSLCITSALTISEMSASGPAAFPFGILVMFFFKSFCVRVGSLYALFSFVLKSLLIG